MKVSLPEVCSLALSLSGVVVLNFAVPQSSAAAAETVGEKPPVGKPAPDFTLPDLDGKKVQLSKLHKKFVVLEWFSDECPWVKKHYNSGNMQAVQKDATKKGAIWLTICSSGKDKPGFHTSEEHKQVLKQWNASMTHFLVDVDGKVGRIYGSKNTPTMYVIDKNGTLVYEGAIDDHPGLFPLNSQGAHNYVTAALEQAMSGKPVADSVTKAYG